MSVCPYCGTNNDDQNKFCVTCGGDLSNINSQPMNYQPTNNGNGMPQPMNYQPMNNGNGMSQPNSNVQQQSKNYNAIIGLVFSIIGFFVFAWAGVLGIILGVQSLNNIKEGKDNPNHKSIATIALVIGIIDVACIAVSLLLYFVNPDLYEEIFGSVFTLFQ